MLELFYCTEMLLTFYFHYTEPKSPFNSFKVGAVWWFIAISTPKWLTFL